MAISATVSNSPKKHVRSVGTACIWPSGVQLRYDISGVTRWRWEKNGRLPPRDVFIRGEAKGWRPETLEAADRDKKQPVQKKDKPVTVSKEAARGSQG